MVNTYTTDGCKPAQDKIQAIVKMPPPCNKKEVQSFTGMINYLTKFSPHLTKLSDPVRELIKEKVPFNWGPEHQESFEALKKELIRAPILAYYNPRKETVLQTNASTKGLEACLLQDDKPIYFASKALTENSKRVCHHQNRITCHCMGSWEVPPLPIWVSILY